MNRTTQERDALVLLACEVCHDETVLLVQSRGADYRIVDCPHCRTTYVVSLIPQEEREPTAVASPPRASA